MTKHEARFQREYLDFLEDDTIKLHEPARQFWADVLQCAAELDAEHQPAITGPIPPLRLRVPPWVPTLAGAPLESTPGALSGYRVSGSSDGEAFHGITDNGFRYVCKLTDSQMEEHAPGQILLLQAVSKSDDKTVLGEFVLPLMRQPFAKWHAEIPVETLAHAWKMEDSDIREQKSVNLFLCPLTDDMVSQLTPSGVTSLRRVAQELAESGDDRATRLLVFVNEDVE